ncbi:16S rRNA (guanine(527)-N(7))-methyltransferase RsmG [Allostreptomyces psammosilenae]|uniref:Ribosomal RNA small subunit methyltransferase G n=1 Tax=Allostreptomyces psammosilenae TaxID=1892865 RepID=A0A852ZVX8_9ACTN|nr:16S rRNA (guanine(527)-N(7))-methyltransferase RsmG [Allostreptomyces psammosilenae]NYI05410.1 16S rRNA (guanine527-N7)-methyltransferase [Allostreptomyces psammosilenae]
MTGELMQESRPEAKPDLPPAAAAVPAAPEAAAKVFGTSLRSAENYAAMLADAGVRRGLIGPREVERLWERHLLNCAVAAEVLPEGASLCDVGSGAGLPGIPLALVRPDLRIILLEPLLRRTTFLQEAVDELGLSNVTVCRGRAEEMIGRIEVDRVTARAVAPLARLAGWGLPLLRRGGEMVALKGGTAEEELASAREELLALGAVEWSVEQVGEGLVDPVTTVVRVRVGDEPGGRRAAARRAAAKKPPRAKGARGRSPRRARQR